MCLTENILRNVYICKSSCLADGFIPLLFVGGSRYNVDVEMQMVNR